MKKTLVVIIVLTMVIAMFAACTPKVDKTNGEMASDEIVEITFWNFPNWAVVDDTPGKYEEMLIEAFEVKNPGIKVNVEMIDFQSGPEKITTAFAAGTGPDVIYDAPGRIIIWGEEGYLASLNDMFTDEFNSNVSATISSACGVGDNKWMYPTHQGPFVMAFNKEKVEAAGLMDMLNLEGNRAWTVEEYEAFLQALVDKGEKGPVFYCANQSGDQGHRAFIANLYGSSITNEDLTGYTINDDAGVMALEWTLSAIEKGLMENGIAFGAGDAIDMFVAGQVSGTILWSTGLEAVKTPDFEQIYLPYPTTGADPALEYLLAGLCVVDNGNSTKIEAAKKFIDFIANDPEWAPKSIEATGFFPANKSLVSSLPEEKYGSDVMQWNASMSDYYSTYYNTIKGYGEMRPLWFATLQAAINGDKTAEAALDDFVEDANATVK